MKELINLFLVALILFPLSVTAVPTQLPNGLVWDDPYQAAYSVSGAYTFSYDHPSLVTQIKFVDMGLPDGDWSCSVTVYNAIGESAYSPEVNFTMVGGIVPNAGIPAALGKPGVGWID
jgi:hypothetical protein